MVFAEERMDGLYTARFVSKRYFPKMQKFRKWYADAKLDDEHGRINVSGVMTVTAQFNYWIENIKDDSIRLNTNRKAESLYI